MTCDTRFKARRIEIFFLTYLLTYRIGLVSKQPRNRREVRRRSWFTVWWRGGAGRGIDL